MAAVVDAQQAPAQGGAGMTGLALSPATRGADFDLCGMRLVVFRFEGTVQIAFLRDGWADGPRKVVANCFADAGTPAQLRAIADHLESLPLAAVAPASEGV